MCGLALEVRDRSEYGRTVLWVCDPALKYWKEQLSPVNFRAQHVQDQLVGLITNILPATWLSHMLHCEQSGCSDANPNPEPYKGSRKYRDRLFSTLISTLFLQLAIMAIDIPSCYKCKSRSAQVRTEISTHFSNCNLKSFWFAADAAFREINCEGCLNLFTLWRYLLGTWSRCAWSVCTTFF